MFAILLILGALTNVVLLHKNQTEVEIQRGKRVFSLFSIVSFKNKECISQSPIISDDSVYKRNGTCYNSDECSAKGGEPSGNCAYGFGVCCLFIVNSGPISQNGTYIRNPDYPKIHSAPNGISYTVPKTNSVCFLRLDFETFTLAAPFSETDGGMCTTDYLQITPTPIGQTIPIICGKNTGQHVYVNFGDQVKIDFSLSGTSTVRIWEIKVSQIECSNPSRPPAGCLQYFTGTRGRITTFNFLEADLSQHLANQDVTACIRNQMGYCCVQYDVCPEFFQGGFSLDTYSTAVIGGPQTNAGVNNQCTMDFVSVPGAYGTCYASSGPIYNKFCTNMLDPGMSNLGRNAPICQCSGPFLVHFHTDNLPDKEFSLGASRGICFDYMLIPCGS